MLKNSNNITRIKTLFLKQIEQPLNASEKAEMQEWLSANSAEYEALLLEINDVEMARKDVAILDSIDEEAAWQQFKERVQLGIPVAPMRRRWSSYAAAAAMIMVVTTGVYLLLNNGQPKESGHRVASAATPIINDVPPGGNKAILTLADGASIVLDTAANGALTQQGNTTVSKLDNGQLAYNTANKKPGAILYNTIATPRGGQYQVTLADGTKVWLNAASSLRFPTAFMGKERSVTLTGEGYFEVAKNAAKPFTVLMNGMLVRVLGTHFNVMGYANEKEMITTLLEGAVKVSKGTETGILKPGMQAKLTAADKMEVVRDVDVEGAIAWKNGAFNFHNTDLETILHQVERWYDVTVIYQSAKPTLYLSGMVSRHKSLSQVLTMLQQAGVQLKLQGKQVIILP
jgi:transmembrane sensor